MVFFAIGFVTSLEQFARCSGRPIERFWRQTGRQTGQQHAVCVSNRASFSLVLLRHCGVVVSLARHASRISNDTYDGSLTRVLRRVDFTVFKASGEERSRFTGDPLRP